MTAAGQEIRGQRGREGGGRGVESQSLYDEDEAFHSTLNHTCIHHLHLHLSNPPPFSTTPVRYRNANFSSSFPIHLFFLIISTIWMPARTGGGTVSLQISMTTGWFILKLFSLPLPSLHPSATNARWRLSFLSSLSYFQSLTSLSQAPLRFHLKTKIYVNLWAGR